MAISMSFRVGFNLLALLVIWLVKLLMTSLCFAWLGNGWAINVSSRCMQVTETILDLPYNFLSSRVAWAPLYGGDAQHLRLCWYGCCVSQPLAWGKLSGWSLQAVVPMRWFFDLFTAFFAVIKLTMRWIQRLITAWKAVITSTFGKTKTGLIGDLTPRA